jgi:hypothetical protein
MNVSGQFHAPAAFPRGKSPQYPLKKVWVGPIAGLDDMGESNRIDTRFLGLPTHSLVATLTELYLLLYIPR